MSRAAILVAGVIAGMAALGAHHLVFPAKWLKCEASHECVRVRADCCGCESGGVSIAINASHLVRYHARRDRLVCEDRCPERFICPAGALTFCNSNNRCEFGFP